MPVRAKLLKFNPFTDAKGFLDLLEQIQFYLRMHEFSTGHLDGSLTTDASNLEASQAWEGQFQLTVRDVALCFLFKNKGTLYHGRGFEMDSVSNAFTSLLSLFSNVQGESESIIEYQYCFGRLILELARCKVVIPSFLLVVLFLHTLHSQYAAIFEQYWSHFKPILAATLDSLVADVNFHDFFTVVDYKKKPGPAPGFQVPAAALANTNSDQKGQVWQTPFEWLAQYGIKGIKGQWTCAMAGMGMRPNETQESDMLETRGE